MNLYFACESLGTLKSGYITLFITAKTITKLNLKHTVCLQRLSHQDGVLLKLGKSFPWHLGVEDVLRVDYLTFDGVCGLGNIFLLTLSCTGKIFSVTCVSMLFFLRVFCLTHWTCMNNHRLNAGSAWNSEFRVPDTLSVPQGEGWSLGEHWKQIVLFWNTNLPWFQGTRELIPVSRNFKLLYEGVVEFWPTARERDTSSSNGQEKSLRKQGKVRKFQFQSEKIDVMKKW